MLNKGLILSLFLCFALPVFAQGTNPLSNARFYVNPHNQVHAYVSVHPEFASRLTKILTTPEAVWFGSWYSIAHVQAAVAALVNQAAKPRTVPVLVVYAIPGRDCQGYSAGGLSAKLYSDWIRKLARGLQTAKAVVIFEPDALLQLTDCLSSEAQAERLALLSDAVQTFRALAPNALVYLDAGHGGASSPAVMSERLKAAGIANATGFSLNVSNYISTEANTVYGTELSALVSEKHFVIDTSRNGMNLSTNEDWCNLPNQTLGANPQGLSQGLIDAYLWIKNPGESDGDCNGGPPAGKFWPEYALGLSK